MTSSSHVTKCDVMSISSKTFNHFFRITNLHAQRESRRKGNTLFVSRSGNDFPLFFDTLESVVGGGGGASNNIATVEEVVAAVIVQLHPEVVVIVIVIVVAVTAVAVGKSEKKCSDNEVKHFSFHGLRKKLAMTSPMVSRYQKERERAEGVWWGCVQEFLGEDVCSREDTIAQ